ncbi:MAG TPA: metallophosphoesterase, partial [Chitinophagaceae bacterium]
MRNSPFWWILIAFMLLLDLYVFQSVKVLTQSSSHRSRLIIHSAYWSISLIAVTMLILLPYLQFAQQNRVLRNTFFAI